MFCTHMCICIVYIYYIYISIHVCSYALQQRWRLSSGSSRGHTSGATRLYRGARARHRRFAGKNFFFATKLHQWIGWGKMGAGVEGGRGWKS